MTLRTYYIVTYGCQMNAYDSELMAGILEARGLERAESEKEADLILVNTCIVRGSAEQRASAVSLRLRGHGHRPPGAGGEEERIPQFGDSKDCSSDVVVPEVENPDVGLLSPN